MRQRESAEAAVKLDNIKLSGADALKGHTRSHPEHDG